MSDNRYYLEIDKTSIDVVANEDYKISHSLLDNIQRYIAITYNNRYLLELGKILSDVTNENPKISDTLCDSTLGDNGYLLKTHKISSDVIKENSKISNMLRDSTLRNITISNNNRYLLEINKISSDFGSEDSEISDSLCDNTLRDKRYLTERDKIPSYFVANETSKSSDSLSDNILRGSVICKNDSYFMNMVIYLVASLKIQLNFKFSL